MGEYKHWSFAAVEEKMSFGRAKALRPEVNVIHTEILRLFV